MYGPMSRVLGKHYCATSASCRLLAFADENNRRYSRLDLSLSSHAAVGLGKNLFPLFARALDLAPDYFDNKVRVHPLAG